MSGAAVRIPLIISYTPETSQRNCADSVAAL
eukprot:SAG11_NODE_22125_length_411_cov_1.820513_1_plen_30_part_10